MKRNNFYLTIASTLVIQLSSSIAIANKHLKPSDPDQLIHDWHMQTSGGYTNSPQRGVFYFYKPTDFYHEQARLTRERNAELDKNPGPSQQSNRLGSNLSPNKVLRLQKSEVSVFNEMDQPVYHEHGFNQLSPEEKAIRYQNYLAELKIYRSILSNEISVLYNIAKSF